MTLKECKVKLNGLESHPQPKRNGFPRDKIIDRLLRFACILPRWVVYVYQTVYLLCLFSILIINNLLPYSSGRCFVGRQHLSLIWFCISLFFLPFREQNNIFKSIRRRSSYNHSPSFSTTNCDLFVCNRKKKSFQALGLHFSVLASNGLPHIYICILFFKSNLA